MGALRKLWPERYMETERTYAARAFIGMPPFERIDADALLIRESVHAGLVTWPPKLDQIINTKKYSLGNYTIPFFPDEINTHNPAIFRWLPSVGEYLERAYRMATDVGMNGVQEEMQAWATLYHMYHWSRGGRPTYMVTRPLWDLLSTTRLPDWEFSTLTFPRKSFYIVLPENTFHFTVTGDIKPQPAEGIFVGIDDVQGRADRSRELSMMVTGRSASASWDDNLAWGQIGIGPNTKLDQISFNGFDSVAAVGADIIGNTLPHFIVSLCLYLDTETPDIVEYVPPRPRSFSEIRSPAQRQRARERDRERLSRYTTIPHFIVGGAIEKQILPGFHRQYFGRGPIMPHEVANHWKMQPFGPRNSLRKKILVHDYWRGGEFAEYIKRQTEP